MLGEVLSRVLGLSKDVANTFGVFVTPELTAPECNDNPPHSWTSPTDMAGLQNVICVPPAPLRLNGFEKETFFAKNNRYNNDITGNCDVVTAGLPCCYMIDDESIPYEPEENIRNLSPKIEKNGLKNPHLKLPLASPYDSDTDSGLVSCTDSDTIRNLNEEQNIDNTRISPTLNVEPPESPIPFRPGFDHVVSFSRTHYTTPEPSGEQSAPAPWLADLLNVRWSSSHNSGRFDDHSYPNSNRISKNHSVLSDTPSDTAVFSEKSPVISITQDCDNNVSNTELIVPPPNRTLLSPPRRFSPVISDDPENQPIGYVEDFQYPPSNVDSINPFDEQFGCALKKKTHRINRKKVRYVNFVVLCFRRYAYVNWVFL